MMLNLIIIAQAVPFLAGLLYFEKKNRTRGKLLTKTPLSLLFVVAALLQPEPFSPDYFHLLLLGLLFCLGGDVFLALPSRLMFLLGLVSFLTGHVFYVLAFAELVPWSEWLTVGAGVTAAVSIVVFVWLRPHLGSMLVPVIAYILVISVMMVGAWAVLAREGLTDLGRYMLFGGALTFYISDLFVARDRFVKPGFFNRLLGLPLYYSGQFMLAFSLGLLKPLA